MTDVAAHGLHDHEHAWGQANCIAMLPFVMLRVGQNFLSIPLRRAVGTMTAILCYRDKTRPSFSVSRRRRCRHVDCILVSHMLRTSISSYRIRSPFSARPHVSAQHSTTQSYPPAPCDPMRHQRNTVFPKGARGSMIGRGCMNISSLHPCCKQS